jgi:hypothetical protein
VTQCDNRRQPIFFRAIGKPVRSLPVKNVKLV